MTTAERKAIIRYDADLPAECRITYEHVAGEDPVMVLTFGNDAPTPNRDNGGAEIVTQQLRFYAQSGIVLDGECWCGYCEPDEPSDVCQCGYPECGAC